MLRIPVFASALLLTAAACNTAERRGGALTLSDIGEFPFPIYKQQATARVWRDVKVDTIAILGESEDYLLYRPGHIRGTRDGEIYVVDTGDNLIKKFDAAGQFVRTYGSGEGKGPGEFSSPISVDLDQAGNVVVPDGAHHTVTTLGPTGDLLEAAKLQFRMYSMAMTDDGRYYFKLQSFDEDGALFGITDALDEPLHTFGVFSLEMRFVIMLQSVITTAANDLVFSPNFFGVIVRFSDTGEIVFARETMDQADPPETEFTTLGGRTAFTYNSETNLKRSVAFSNENLYVDSFPLSREREALVIDAYDAADGSYDYSFELPGYWSRFDIEGDYAFAVSGANVAVFRLSF